MASTASNQRRVIIVGGGLAGLAAAIRIAEAGVPVDLFSMVPVKRSHSVCAQGGINACTAPVRQEGFTEYEHFTETLYGGDYLNHQPPVYEMAFAAPDIIDLLDRMGVPFNRTPEGRLDRRYFGGSLFRRTHFAGASTGQQLLYALDEQTRRYEVQGLVRKYEFWEFLWPVVDDAGVCRGIVAQDMRTMEIRAFPGDGVVMATGGNGLIYGKSTMSVICTGGAAARCYRAGASLGNPEMMQVHPTAIPGADKCRLMSESARGEGGRVWVPAIKEGGVWKPHPRANADPRTIPEHERYYILEEAFPSYGNLVSRDMATREIFFTCQKGLGIGGGNMVYLDCTHLTPEHKAKLGAIFEIYEKFVGDDPREMPMKIFPAIHYTMGGLYTTYAPYEPDKDPRPVKRKPNEGMIQGDPRNMMTDIEGLYAFGEVNYQYHGATRLGANALLSCIFDGLFCGLSVANYARKTVKTPAASLEPSLFDKYVQQEKQVAQKLIDGRGRFNPYEIHKRLGEEMTAAATVVKEEKRMQQAYGVLRELKEQYKDLRLSDTDMWTNQNLSFARALKDMLIYAEAILAASLARRESRGSHWRSDYQDRNDAEFLKTARVKYDAAADRPIVEWEDVPTPLVTPRARTYGKVEEKSEGRKQAEVARNKPGAEGYSQKPTDASPAYSGADGGARNPK